MVAIGLATLIVGERTIYESQLRSRADAPAHRAAFGLPLLSSVMVADVMTPPPLIIPEAMPIDEARRLLASEDLSGAPVIDDAGDLLGVLSADDARQSDQVTAGAAADRVLPHRSLRPGPRLRPRRDGIRGC